jgi:hypothetical protein
MIFRRLARRLRTSVALGLPPVPAPAMVFVPVGVLLGPWGTSVLDARVIGHLEPVVSILLATFGVLAGLALRDGPSPPAGWPTSTTCCRFQRALARAGEVGRAS